MKATGIVRRIDDLGRVVVPKEIRRTLRIREGDPLEIFTDREGEIILKKYSPIGELGIFAGQYAESLAQTMGCLVCVSDRDHIIAAAGNGKREYDGKPISQQLENMIEERSHHVSARNDKDFVRITLDDQANYQTLDRVLAKEMQWGPSSSAVRMIRKLPDAPREAVQTAAGFLGKQMEQ